jgi:hypothetical protein
LINESIVTWLRANVSELKNALVWDTDFQASQYEKPFAVVRQLIDVPEQWILGDKQRKHNAKTQISIYNTAFDTGKYLTMKIQRLIETISTTDATPLTVPGIDLKGVWDLLSNPSGDLKTYTSDQPGWFASPVPIVYTGTTIIVATAYTVDYTNGKITFAVARGATEKIYATYKCGVVDFVIKEQIYPQTLIDIANKAHKCCTVITLDTWFFIKTTANKIV